jgi:hypothetical protein
MQKVCRNTQEADEDRSAAAQDVSNFLHAQAVSSGPVQIVDGNLGHVLYASPSNIVTLSLQDFFDRKIEPNVLRLDEKIPNSGLKIYTHSATPNHRYKMHQHSPQQIKQLIELIACRLWRVSQKAQFNLPHGRLIEPFWLDQIDEEILFIGMQKIADTVCLMLRTHQ